MASLHGSPKSMVLLPALMHCCCTGDDDRGDGGSIAAKELVGGSLAELWTIHYCSVPALIMHYSFDALLLQLAGAWMRVRVYRVYVRICVAYALTVIFALKLCKTGIFS